jgi:hypothetical protein
MALSPQDSQSAVAADAFLFYQLRKQANVPTATVTPWHFAAHRANCLHLVASAMLWQRWRWLETASPHENTAKQVAPEKAGRLPDHRAQGWQA